MVCCVMCYVLCGRASSITPGDGYLSFYEMEPFLDQQRRRLMLQTNQGYTPGGSVSMNPKDDVFRLVDVVCQLTDAIKPREHGKVRTP